MTFGEKLTKLRKCSGMSQEALAEELLVSRQAVSRWETGETMPDSENLRQLSRIFRVSTDYLLHDDYEGDRDIPAVKEAEETLTRQQRLNICFLLAAGAGAMSMLVGFFLWAYLETPVSILIGCAGYMTGILYFKTNMFKYAAEDQIRSWKKKLIRTYIWFLGIFPGIIMIQGLAAQFFRQQDSLAFDLSCLLIYLAVCGTVTLALREKKQG